MASSMAESSAWRSHILSRDKYLRYAYVRRSELFLKGRPEYCDGVEVEGHRFGCLQALQCLCSPLREGCRVIINPFLFELHMKDNEASADVQYTQILLRVDRVRH